MSHFKAMIAFLLFGSGVVPSSGAAFSCPDLALVLAIDASGSIDDRDFGLQQQGYAAAFRDARVQDALDSAGVVDVAVVLWGDEDLSPEVLDWQRLTGPGDARRLSDSIAGLARRVTGDTGIGRGLWVALDLLAADKSCAARRIINVSGDGKESFGARPRNHLPLALARARAAQDGVTINGLAISATAPDLPGYYHDQVISGPDAFVMSVDTFEAFGEAITRKLAREIALPMVAGMPMQARSMP
jgi:Protein of unknown function (DUF1194)